MKQKYEPTRKRLIRIEAECRNLPCQDTAGQTDYPCGKCQISSRYERLSGIRLEDIEGSLV